MCMVTEEGKLQARSIIYLKFFYSPIVQWLCLTQARCTLSCIPLGSPQAYCVTSG